MKTNVTMQDIANRFSISKVTVSKALNNKDGVSDDLKQQIIKAASEMGYQINKNSKSSNCQGYNNIGVVIAEKFIDENAFYMVFYKEIVNQLSEKNYSVIFNMLKEDDERNLVLPKSYIDESIDGIIVIGQISEDYSDQLAELNIPAMFLDFYYEHANIDAVITDSFFCAYDITNYLIKVGHRKIAYVGNIYATSSIQDRYLGFYKSHLEHRLKLREEYIIRDRDDEHGMLIDLVLPQEMPTAFVCNCDRIAYNLIQQLQLLGYNVPDDISVVGFDNNLYSEISSPKITTVEVNVKKMSETVINGMLMKIQDRSFKFGNLEIKGTIVYKDSVKPYQAD